METSANSFRQHGAFRLVTVLCMLFLVLTAVAMWLYPGNGGHGYSFLHDFLSDLGTTRTRANLSNLASMTLFVAALAGVGFGLPIFFLAFAQFIEDSPIGRTLAALGTAFGLAAGISFIGVAVTPWNLYLQTHMEFMVWAFQALLAASLIHGFALWCASSLPRRFAWISLGFALALVAYVLLLHYGPSTGTPEGRSVQVAGQKLIVYAGVLSILAQARAALRLQALRVIPGTSSANGRRAIRR